MSNTMSSTNKFLLFILVLANYFSFMLISTIVGVLLIKWRIDFQLTVETGTLLGAAPFIAYGLTSLPQGILLERIGSKNMFIYACTLVCLGSLIFALYPGFNIGIVSLFFIGTGITGLQIVGNLLVKRLDEDPEKYSRNLTLTQVACGVGAMSGGFLNQYLTVHFGESFHWTAFYFGFSALALILAVFAYCIYIPEKQKDLNASKPTTQDYINIISNPMMLLFAGGIFIYVGIEVGIANFIKDFMLTKYSMNGDKIFGLYWGLQSVGRLTGGVVLSYLRTSTALITYALLALASLLVALIINSAFISGIAFICVGFFTSIMFPSIFSLAINRFSDREDTASGILCTAIVGGAVLQIIIGYLIAPLGGLANSLGLISIISFLYIAFIGYICRPAKQQVA